VARAANRPTSLSWRRRRGRRQRGRWAHALKRQRRPLRD
jgi:hypothetical protein